MMLLHLHTNSGTGTYFQKILRPLLFHIELMHCKSATEFSKITLSFLDDVDVSQKFKLMISHNQLSITLGYQPI